MYERQALFSHIFDFALRHGFHFAGFTYLQEICRSACRSAHGQRGFWRSEMRLVPAPHRQRKIDRPLGERTAPHAAEARFRRAQFRISGNMRCWCWTQQSKRSPTAPSAHVLMSRDCYRLLYELGQAAEALPAGFLHTQRSELVAERRKMIEQGYLGAAKEHAARGRMAATPLSASFSHSVL